MPIRITDAEAKAAGLIPPSRRPAKARGRQKASKATLREPRRQAVSLTLPWPPAVNNLYATVNGHRVLSKRGREYKKAVVVACCGNINCGHVEGRLGVIISAFPPDNRRRDLDGILKIVLDSLVYAGVMADDSQVDYLEVSRRTPTGDGHLYVTVREGLS